MNTPKKATGFTIIELLVVIVVIGILATISIVSFNGIAKRADNTAVIAAVDSWSKTLSLYKAATGEFPAIENGDHACLGSGSFEADANFSAGQCYYRKDGTGTVLTINKNQQLMNELASYASNLPDGTIKTFKYSEGDILLKTRGIVYGDPQAEGNNTATLLYYVAGDQECGRGVKYYLGAGGVDVTQCSVALN